MNTDKHGFALTRPAATLSYPMGEGQCVGFVRFSSVSICVYPWL
jgi:hypothetical protein